MWQPFSGGGYTPKEATRGSVTGIPQAIDVGRRDRRLHEIVFQPCHAALGHTGSIVSPYFSQDQNLWRVSMDLGTSAMSETRHAATFESDHLQARCVLCDSTQGLEGIHLSPIELDEPSRIFLCATCEDRARELQAQRYAAAAAGIEPGSFGVAVAMPSPLSKHPLRVIHDIRTPSRLPPLVPPTAAAKTATAAATAAADAANAAATALLHQIVATVPAPAAAAAAAAEAEATERVTYKWASGRNVARPPPLHIAGPASRDSETFLRSLPTPSTPRVDSAAQTSLLEQVRVTSPRVVRMRNTATQTEPVQVLAEALLPQQRHARPTTATATTATATRTQTHTYYPGEEPLAEITPTDTQTTNTISAATDLASSEETPMSYNDEHYSTITQSSGSEAPADTLFGYGDVPTTIETTVLYNEISSEASKQRTRSAGKKTTTRKKKPTARRTATASSKSSSVSSGGAGDKGHSPTHKRESKQVAG